MAALHVVAELTDLVGYSVFDSFLGGPAQLIGGRTQISACDENDGVAAYAPCYPDSRSHICMFEPVAQLVEHRTFNAMVAGSSPARLTIFFVSDK